jgi:type I restriction enzyme S subunit
MENQMNIPKLRFPDYSGEWEWNYLGDLSDNVRYGMNSAAMSFDGINKYIRITDIDENTREFKPNPLTSPDGIIEEKYKLRKGDIVFARTGASVGKSYLYDENDGNLLFAGFLIKFSIKQNNAYFIYSQTLKDSYDKWVKLMSMRSGQPGINAEEFKTFSFFKPTLPEQTKIASFLTAVDSRLNQLKQKKSLLEQYKKGVMQKIFAQEIRFKDDYGKQFPDWETHNIADYIDFLSGFPFNGDDISDDSSGILLLRGINITEGSIRHSKEIDKYYCGDKSKLEKYFTKEGDLVIGMDGSKVGKNTALIDSFNANTLLVQRVARLREKNNASIKFIYHHINSIIFQKYVDEVKTSSGIPHISATQIKEFKIPFPCLTEQTKIANFLTAIDERIALCGQQIEKTELWKKGLLQQMFC